MCRGTQGSPGKLLLMKRLLRFCLPALILLSLLTTPAFGQARIGTIDLRKVFDKYWKRIQADAAIKERAAGMEKEYNSMMADYNKSKEDYQKLLASASDQAVSSEERDKRKKTAEEKLKQLKITEDSLMQFQKSSRTQLEEQLKRMRDTILTEIRTVVTAKAQAANYNLVFDTAAETPNATPILLYINNKDNDLTENVLSQLNAAAPPDSAAKTDEKKK